jgi:hypothetical protein
VTIGFGFGGAVTVAAGTATGVAATGTFACFVMK